MSPSVSSIDLHNTASVYFAPATSTSNAHKQVYVSGQVGASSEGTVPFDYVSQIHLALYNLRRIIIGANAKVRDIAKLTLLWSTMIQRIVSTLVLCNDSLADIDRPLPLSLSRNWLFHLGFLRSRPYYPCRLARSLKRSLQPKTQLTSS